MVTVMDTERTTAEWQAHVGEQFRALRIEQGLDQVTVARNASVSRGAIRHLEDGSGVSFATVIKVARALGRDDWLDSIDVGAGEISPMELLRQERRQKRQRQRASREAGN